MSQQPIILLNLLNGVDLQLQLGIYRPVSFILSLGCKSSTWAMGLGKYLSITLCDIYILVAFATYTLANLLPRGLSHHQWYIEKFEDYPKDRKAFIPFLL